MYYAFFISFRLYFAQEVLIKFKTLSYLLEVAVSFPANERTVTIHNKRGIMYRDVAIRTRGSAITAF